jgi:DNA-binding NarL/FixJ family response regulator
MDIRMPDMDGIEATRRIAADPGLGCVRVLILTNFGLDSYVFAALRAGASGFLLKDADPADLLQAVAVVARGDALLAPAVTRTLISEFVTAPPPTDPAAGRDLLTAREQEIAELVARGLSNDEIADRMVISPLTVKTHVNRAMMKLHCRDRAQLVVWAYESGLIAPRRR